MKSREAEGVLGRIRKEGSPPGVAGRGVVVAGGGVLMPGVGVGAGVGAGVSCGTGGTGGRKHAPDRHRPMMIATVAMIPASSSTRRFSFSGIGVQERLQEWYIKAVKAGLRRELL